jgi:hypothetical protein
MAIHRHILDRPIRSFRMKDAMQLAINYSRINDNIDFNDNVVAYDYDKVKILNTVLVSNKTVYA